MRFMGGIYQFKLFNKVVIAISEPSFIQSILRDHPETYRRVSAIERVGAELGSNGVFAAEGEQWRHQRQVTIQAFKPEQLRQFFPVLHHITERLQKHWHKISNSGQAIDIQEDWMRFTVDVTTNFAFGHDINVLKQDGDSFQGHLEKFLPVLNRRANAPFPYWHFVKLPSERGMEKSLVFIKETIAAFIQQAQDRLERQPDIDIEPSNFLEALLLAKDEKGNGLTDPEIQGNIITILLAGEETGWFLLYLSHPAHYVFGFSSSPLPWPLFLVVPLVVSVLITWIIGFVIGLISFGLGLLFRFTHMH